MTEEKKIGEWKDVMVKELTERIKKDTNIYFSDYIGLKTAELSELRHLLEPYSSGYLVVKNSIARIALENTGLDELTKFIEGGTGIILGGDNPLAAAKVASKFSRSHQSLKFKGGYLDGQIIDRDRIKYIASLPNKEELIAKIVFGVKSPISGFVSVLGNTLKSLVFVIAAIKGKKGG